MERRRVWIGWNRSIEVEKPFNPEVSRKIGVTQGYATILVEIESQLSMIVDRDIDTLNLFFWTSCFTV